MGKLLESLQLISELESTSGRNDKETVLKKGENNEIFKEMFYYTYNPFLKYHVFKFDSSPSLSGKVDDVHWKEFKDLLNILNKRILTGGEAISAVVTFFEKLSPPEHEVFKRILQKDLNVGATIKTFNSVYPKSIPVFVVMLAKEKKKVKKLPDSVVIEPKLDGYRVLSFVQNGTVEQFTRNGKRILGFNDVCRELSQLSDGVYDGEIVGKQDMFNDMQKAAFKKTDDKHGTYYIFDFLSIEEFESGKSKDKLLDRKEKLNDNMKLSLKTWEHLVYVSHTSPVDPHSKLIEEMYDYFLESGYEGVMLKDVNSYYECKRSSSWLKVVPFISVDLSIIDIYEGKPGTKYVGQMGGVTVEYKGYKVDIGSGWSDELRKEIWDNKDQFIGKVIEIHARQPSNNEKGEESLRFPRFKKLKFEFNKLRPDKD